MKWSGASELSGLVRPITELQADKKNVRRHDEKSVAALVRSLGECGQQKPVVVTLDGVVIAGNGTLEAAKRLGWEGLACVEFVGSEAEARSYAIADNRTAELSTWDKGALREALKETPDASFQELHWKDIVKMGDAMPADLLDIETVQFNVTMRREWHAVLRRALTKARKDGASDSSKALVDVARLYLQTKEAKLS